MIGNTINERYQIDKELGRGGTGTVYRAHDSTLNRDVALKLMSNTNLGTEGRARLLHEAQTIAQLDHPNIVTVFDAGEYERAPYIVMQLVEGGTLHEQRPDSLDETLRIVKQVCAALECAHQHGVIHRDLKPENVALSEDGTVKLMDFGLARSVASRMTSEGNIVGTVFYMAPEQAMGQELDARADLYALGVMLYELTTGELPFVGENPVAVISQHINAPVVPPRAKREDLPGYVDNLILQLLEKDPQDRPESAAAVLKILESPEEAEDSLRERKELFVLDRIVRGRIVGRKEEYEEARSLWREAVAGAGQTLLISGEPGIGKTRLMREVVTQTEVSGGRALVGEASAESNTPYGAFAQMVRKALDQQSKNGVELPDFVLDDVLNLAPDLRPYYPDIEPNPKLDPESGQMRLLENMVAFCSAFSESAPLLLVMDDAHWADSSSIAMFQHLARRTRRQPVMLLATYREVELREARPFNEMLLELNRQRIGTRIKLARLDKEETRAMLEAIFNDEITPDFLEGIYRETDGNPFFIEEVCRALVESGKLYFAEGEWHRPGMDELEIPQGVQVAVESRLTKLPEDVQEALRMAAVLGREFDYEVLIEASDLSEDAIIDAIELADRAQMVQEGREDTLYEFVHALVPQSIRENTHRLRLRKLHKRAASAYEVVQPENYESLAYHHSEGGNDGQALHYYTLAGERALANYANQDAENHFTAALNLTEDEIEKASLLAQLGESQARLSRHNDAVQTWQRAIDLLLEQGNKDQAAELYARSGRATWQTGDTQASLDVCRQGLSAVEGAPNGPGLAHLLSETARACYFNGVKDEVEQYANRALDMAEQFDLLAVRADSLNTLGTSKGAGSSDAIPMLEEAIQISESANLLTEAMRANNNLGVLLADQGNYEAAIRSYHHASELARQKSDLNLELFFSANELWSRIFLGQLREVDRDHAELSKLLGDRPDPGSGGRTLEGMEISLAFAKGEFRQALQMADRKIRDDHETNDLFSLLLTLGAKFHLLFLDGKLEQAQELAEDAIEVARRFDQGVQQHCWASKIASRRGDAQHASESLESARKIVGNNQPVFWRQVNIVRAEAHLLAAQEEWEAAWNKFSENQANLASKQLRWHAVWFATEWADAHLLRGEAEDIARAQELLEEARSEADDMGAAGWVELIDGKLALIGSNP
ncbi:MAG: protein kinase [Anaerolineales bacterium]